jgi:retinol dehydrogenase 12
MLVWILFANQLGRVHIVTGGYSGCGYELVKILYEKNATVYLGGRSEQKATQAIEELKKSYPESKGKVEFLKLDLSDLSTIKPSAEEFMSKESRLDVLTNNAGVMVPPLDTRDAQGNELQLGTNCLGPFLLTKSLLPVLLRTAKDAPTGSVRVTWASSLAATLQSPPEGVAFVEDGSINQLLKTPELRYGQSKAGNTFLAAEFANRYGKDGIISVSWNPGNLKTELQRHMPKVQKFLLDKVLLHPPLWGAYTELWAGWSTELTESQNGSYIAPWGRVRTLRDDVTAGLKRKSEGGTGTAEKFWDWCEKMTEKYA